MTEAGTGPAGTGLCVTVLGCGGSMGLPLVGGHWGACDPTNPRNRRRRPAILVRRGETTILVDTGPDLRQQLLDAEVTRLDAVLYTHGHADHLHGIDDLRPLTFGHGPIPAYADRATIGELEARFAYAVSSVTMERGIYKPILDIRPIDGPFDVDGLPVIPFAQNHGPTESLGFRFGPFAYSTDVVALDDAAFEALRGVEVWIVDALREEPHLTHAHVGLALEWVERLKPRQTYLTHMNQSMDYGRLSAMLPKGVEPAYDGLEIRL